MNQLSLLQMGNMKIMDRGRYIIRLFLKNVRTHTDNAYFPNPDNPNAFNITTRLEQVEYLKTSTNEWIYGL